MGKDTKIEWAHHSWNPWWGCQRVSPGCEHCYAETLNRRYGFNNWGPAKTTSRRLMSDGYWKQPLRWNELAQRAGKRARVFCASMADVFEDHPDLPPLRQRLWLLIEQTPHLDWLLLTKRPENIDQMLPLRWGVVDQMPRNVWLGFSAEDQQRFDERWQIMEWLKRMRHPAVIFLSAEPLLGPLDISDALDEVDLGDEEHQVWSGTLDWVIAGGESGPGARPMHPDWARSLRDQCQRAGVAFFFKQWGEWCPGEYHRGGLWDGYWKFEQGSTFHEETHGRPEYQRWQGLPSGDYRHRVAIRPWPDVACVRLGKGWSGRSLDAKEWNEVPQ